MLCLGRSTISTILSRKASKPCQPRNVPIDEGKRAILASLIPVVGLLCTAPKAWAELPFRGRSPRNTKSPSVENLARGARLETDPESALPLWDEVINQGGETAGALYERGNCYLLIKMYKEAVTDLSKAQMLYKGVREGGLAFLPSGATVPIEIVMESLAFDGMGLAKGQLGDWEGSLDCFKRALGTVGSAGASEASLPEGTPFSGLRGSAATLGQRLELHAALAKFAQGNISGAVKDLRRVDTGPNPDGYPQFWDARAALAVSLSASGEDGLAETEWAQLCQPHPPPPPATPSNPLFARVNLAAQAMLLGEGMMTDNSCEDFESGVYLPCDDAGIPGLGGSSSPCSLYTSLEVRSRLWPEPVVEALENFLRLNPEIVSQNRARGVLKKPL